MTMSRNAVGNLITRYKSVLQNCSLLNVFGTLALATLLIASPAQAASYVDTVNAYDPATGTLEQLITAYDEGGYTIKTTTDTNEVVFSVGTAKFCVLKGGQPITESEGTRVEVSTGESGGNISSSTFIDNESADASGGAVNNNDGTIGDITGSTFIDNTANMHGGAIYNGGTVFYESTIGDITDSIFIGNTATLSGGAISNDFDGSTIGKISNSTFIGNMSGGDSGASGGGAIRNLEGSIDGIFSSLFIGNTADNQGGAIYNDGPIGDISDSTFTGNIAKASGGAIYNNGALIGGIFGSTFADNTAKTSGGAIDNNGGIDAIANSTFISNTVKQNGGAIANNSYAFSVEGSTETIYTNIKEISNSTFTGNTAGNQGGAIYNKSLINFTGTNIFTDNTAKQGGAICNLSKKATIDFSGENIFSGNKAGEKLNDIHNAGTINVSGKMTLDGGITGTKVGTTNFKSDSTLTIKASTDDNFKVIAVTALGGTIKTEAGAKLVVTGVTLDAGKETSFDLALTNAITEKSWGYTADADTADTSTISFDNVFYEATKTAYADSKYTITVGQVAATEALGSSFDASLGALIDNAVASGETSAALDHISAVAKQEGGAKTLESGSKMSTAAGVVPSLGAVNTAATANVGTRTSMVPQGKVTAASETSTWLAMDGNGAILPAADGGNMAQGFGIWFMPMYNHTSADGFKSDNSEYGYDTNVVGATLGADYTFASDLRLGLAFNVGEGSSSSTGDFASTDNDFDYVGVSVYGAKHFDQFGLSFDMGYTMSENDIDQVVYATSTDASLFTIGAKAEYQIPLDSFNVTPYAGVRINYYEVDAYDTMAASGSAVYNNAASDSTVWEIPVGVTLDTTSKVGSWNMTPSLGLGVKFAMGDLDAEQKVSIDGIAGSSVLSSEVADEVTFQGALGLGFAKDNCTIGFNYNLDLSENVESHGLSVNLRYDF